MRHGVGSVVWVVIAVGVVALVIVGLQSMGGSSEPEVLMSSRQWVPLSRLAAPVRAEPIIAQRGRRIQFSLRMSDAVGNTVRAVRLAGGGKPAAPKILIIDADDKVVHRGKMEHG
jgi:hypothetical protein